METFEHITNALAEAFENNDCIREHALIQLCKSQALSPLNELSLSRSIELFKAHFIIRHCLYQLQNRWRQARRYELDISLIEIKRDAFSSGPNGLKHFDYLKEYYLDLDNLENTTEAEVNLMLNGFWNYFSNEGQRAKALDALGLSENADYPSIKRKFKELAQKMHPDKGGSEADFQELVAAKNTLEALKNVSI